LLVGVSHVCFLAFLGFQMKEPKQKIACGLRVQTSGYLHTLIGFCGALLQLQPQNLLETIKIPLSYALVTSIIGWWFGGELVNRFHEEDDDPIKDEVEKIASKFRSFSDEITVIHEKYIKQIESSAKSFQDNMSEVGASYERMIKTYEAQLNRLNSKQSELLNQLESYQKQFVNSQNSCYRAIESEIKKSIELSYSLNGSIESLSSSFSTKYISSITSNITSLNEHTKLASDGMNQVASQSYDVAKYLNDSQILIEQLEKLLDSISHYQRTM
jgi:chromosome segregation ATPase